MRLKLLAIALLSLTIGCNDATSQKPKDGNVQLKTANDSISYALGVDVGKNIGNLKLEDVNTDILYGGLVDGIKGTVQISDEQMSQIFADLNTKMREKQMAEQMKQGETNLTKAKEFLAKNKTAEGVKETASGLQYKVIKSGSGKKPQASSQVKVHYHGTLVNGEVFDSSVDRGEPIVFGVGQVIKGWTEALLMMSTGDKWMLYIHPDLAYGPQARPPKIEANSLLIFEVELLEVID